MGSFSVAPFVNDGSTPAIVVMAVLILMVVLVGMWSSRSLRMFHSRRSTLADYLVMNRSLPEWLGAVSIVASLTCTVMIVGTTETLHRKGLVWSLFPLAMPAALAVAAVTIAPHMRGKKYITILDPLQERLGRVVGTVFALPLLYGNVLYFAAVIGTLGGTFEVALGLPHALGVVASVTLCASYTLSGGLTAVVHMDAFQSVVMVVGGVALLVCVLHHPSVSPILRPGAPYLRGWTELVSAVRVPAPAPGPSTVNLAGVWFDELVTVFFGEVWCQQMLMHVLASKGPAEARRMGLYAALGMVISSMLCLAVAAAGSSTRWVELPDTELCESATLIVACMIRHLLPPWATILSGGKARGGGREDSPRNLDRAHMLLALRSSLRLCCPHVVDRLCCSRGKYRGAVEYHLRRLAAVAERRA